MPINNIYPLRLESATPESFISHNYVSLVQAYFREESRTDILNETTKQKKDRLKKFLSLIIKQFLFDHRMDIKTRNSFEDAISRRKLLERIMTNNSIFIPKNEDGHEDVVKKEEVFNLIFDTLDHAWRAKHSGLYARDLNVLARRISYVDSFWNSEPGTIKLEDMGLNAELIQRDRSKHPLLFGPAEQLNPLPAMLTMEYRDLPSAINEANEIIAKIIGQYVELTPLVAKKMLLCLPTLIYDQVSRSSSGSSNMHVHLEAGEVQGLISETNLKDFNRSPLDSLRMKIGSETKKKKSDGTMDMIDISLETLLFKLNKYFSANTDNMTNEDRVNVDKFIKLVSFLYKKYKNQKDISYVEFAKEMNQLYIKSFFPYLNISVETIDSQVEGRLGKFFDYIKDMDKLVDFMVEHRFFESCDDLCVRVALKGGSGKYSKFARYRWNKSEKCFVVNENEKMDYGSEIATTENGKYKKLSLEQIRDTDKFVSIALKDLEYVMLGFGIMPEMVILDDGVFYYAYKYLSDACQRVTGSKPLYYAYNEVDPTKFDY